MAMCGSLHYITACCSPSPVSTLTPPPFLGWKEYAELKGAQKATESTMYMKITPQSSAFNHMCLVMIID